jgi:tRNA threonylcarbamoyl adenosine modification protein (Sua5/YciO/YrdC/YwlC family)
MADRDLAHGIDALRRGEIVGLPTDTVYGIAADPFSRRAVQQLFEAKGRPSVRPIPILAADLAGIRRVARIDDTAAAEAERHWPGALTLVLPRAAGMPAWLGDPERDTVGVRIPDHPTALALLSAFGPLAVTSANRSGEEPAVDAAGARAALGDAVAAYLAGAAGGDTASTVVDLSGVEARVLRAGPVPWGAP